MRVNWRPELEIYKPYVETLTAAVNAGARFVAEVEAEHLAQVQLEPRDRVQNGRWLTYGGEQGSGKTTLASQVYRSASRFNPGNVGLWVGGDSRNFKRRPHCVGMEATEFADRCATDRGYPDYLRDDFLVWIDDIGSADESKESMRWLATALYRLCNARLGKWTLFTTNLTMKEIGEKIDPRVLSRLIRERNEFVRIDAPDYAVRKKGARS